VAVIVRKAALSPGEDLWAQDVDGGEVLIFAGTPFGANRIAARVLEGLTAAAINFNLARSSFDPNCHGAA
jgi:hypothetical protein